MSIEFPCPHCNQTIKIAEPHHEDSTPYHYTEKDFNEYYEKNGVAMQDIDPLTDEERGDKLCQ